MSYEKSYTKKDVEEMLNSRMDSMEQLTRSVMMEVTKLREHISKLERRNSSDHLIPKRTDSVSSLNDRIESGSMDLHERKDRISSTLSAVLKDVSPTAVEPTTTNSMTALRTGDQIFLHHDDARCVGHVVGDSSLGTVGIRPEIHDSTNPFFIEGVFRLCSGLNFRARTERRKSRKSGNLRDTYVQSTAIEDAIKREKLEETQNFEHIEQLSTGMGTDVVKFGDVVQLQHVSSELFLATHKTPANLNPNCRRVSLKQGSLACNFRVLPRFKVRSIGSLVYAGDHIQLQSMKFPHLRLGVSSNNARSLKSYSLLKSQLSGAINNSELFEVLLREPASMRHQCKGEVNGTMDLYGSFHVDLHFRPSQSHSLFSGSYFRLFHPEANAFIQASSNSDKGEVLDASEGEQKRFERADDTPAHVPYLKSFVTSSADASNPLLTSTKPIDLKHCSEIHFNSPLKLKHVPSGKYLSVDSSSRARRVTLSVNEESALETDDEDDDGSGFNSEGIYYDVGLVFDGSSSIEEGKFGSMSSIVFYLMATDVTDGTLQNVACAVRLEHRASNGNTVYFRATQMDKSELDRNYDAKLKQFQTKEKGRKVCFSSHMSSLDALRIQPMSSRETKLLHQLISKTSLLKSYTYQWYLAISAGSNFLPDNLVRAVVVQCLDLLDLLQKAPPPRRHENDINAYIKEAEKTDPFAFALLHVGTPNTLIQKMCLELKLIDAVFDAINAPYNYDAITESFGKFPEAFLACQKFLYVLLQSLIRENLISQKYLTEKYSRTYRSPPPQTNEMFTLSPNRNNHLEKNYELNRDLIVKQSGESQLGATVTLAQLLHSSEEIVQLLVDNDLMTRFKSLVEEIGPEMLYIHLFNAICIVEGKACRSSQDICLRLLWMNEKERYSFGVTFHEMTKSDQANCHAKLMTGRYRAPAGAPKAYLGKVESNDYDPVCICWTGKDEWEPNCGALWYSPRAMAMTTVKLEGVSTNQNNAQFVPLEDIMWVLEPHRLCKMVTGVYWKPPVNSSKPVSKGRHTSIRNSQFSFSDLSVQLLTSDDSKATKRKQRFDHKLKLASYIVAELQLLANMCKGRSYNCINWLEKSFSYDMLLNMATNPSLPYNCKAASMELAQAIYVDRFPQFTHGGGASLPHKLWLFHENVPKGEEDSRRSLTPVLKKAMTLASDDAFPAFFLTQLSSAFNDPNPVLSHPDHFKFFLLRKLYNDTVTSFGYSGRIIHDDADFNRLGIAAIHGQQALLLFGFQSTYIKLKELCEPNARLLDGRSDLKSRSGVFEDPKERYKIGGSDTEVVLKIKKELIKTFNEIGDLCTNFRLGQTLHLFKEKAIKWTTAECSSKGIDSKNFLFHVPSPKSLATPGAKRRTILGTFESVEAQYIQQSTPEAVLSMYHDFEALFPGGTSEAAKLDFISLCDKPDFNVALIDAMMYEDDELMAASLRLLDNIYGQRTALLKSLQDVVLLEKPQLPVFGDVHRLSGCITELIYLVRTTTSWGVSSDLSGPFGNKEFTRIMHILDQLLLLIYEEQKPIGRSSTRGSNGRGIGSVDIPVEESSHGWEVDISDKWAESTRISFDSGATFTMNPSSNFQNLLHACNLQEVLLEAVLIDPLVARNDITSTPEDIAESERRLTLVIRAALSLTSAFVVNNPRNQSILFARIHSLTKLMKITNKWNTTSTLTSPMRGGGELFIQETFASKAEEEDDDDDDFDEGEDDFEGMGSFTTGAKVPLFTGPKSSQKVAEEAIISILHKNSTLCAKLDPAVPIFFFSLAALEKDFSTASTLDIIFAVVKPERSPNSEFQIHACTKLLELPNNCLLNAVSASLKTVSDFKSTSSSSSSDVKDPARLLRIMKVLMVGGNERTANLLSQKAGLTLDATCRALVSHIDQLFHQNSVRSFTESDLTDTQETNDKMLLSNHVAGSGDKLLKMLSERNSISCALFELIVEQIFLLPLNTIQLNSRYLWLLIGRVVSPAMESLGKLKQMNSDNKFVCDELVSMLEFLFMSFFRLSILDVTIEDPVKGKLLRNIAGNVSSLLSRRVRPPFFLEDPFRTVAAEFGTESLNRTQFGSLIHTIVNEYVPLVKNSEELLKEACYAFDNNDLFQDGLVDVYEFVNVFKSFSFAIQHKHPELYNKMEEEENKSFGHLLNLTTVEGAERIIHIYHGHGNALGLKRFSRADRFGNRVQHKRSSVAATSMFSPVRGVKSGTFSFNRGESSFMESSLGSVISINEKFKTFQQALDKNVHISQALQRRRFSMVLLLEQGTPGPPPGAGRSLNMVREHAKIYSPTSTVGSTKTSTLTKTMTKKTTTLTTSSIIKSSNDPVKFRSNNQRHSSSQLVNNRKKWRKSMAKITPIGLFFAERSVSDDDVRKDEATLVIQNAYRNMIARYETNVAKDTMRPGEGKNSNRLSGAVELTWDDITTRFVRYLNDHFWEKGEISRVNISIVETWLAHLIKARTYFLDANGIKLNESKVQKAQRLEFHEPYHLKPEELKSYNHKKCKLNSLGVTKLLAKILSSLSDDITVGGLPDFVLQLLVELLDGGNVDVQQTLFDYLIETDNEGKFLAHIEKRIHYAFKIYLEGKKMDITRSISLLGQEISEACEHLILSFRFLQLLCEGHHLGFQDFLRHQVLHSSTQVNLIKICVDHVILLCDSTSNVSKFSTLEVALLSQMLALLIESMQGPCSGNQELIIKSEIVSSLNFIIYAINENEKELSNADPTYLDMRSLSCILLSASLEGRSDSLIHINLDRRLMKVALVEYKAELEKILYGMLALTNREKRLPTNTENERFKAMQTALVAATTVLLELDEKTVAKSGEKGVKSEWLSELLESNKASSSSTNLIGVIEIAWNGQVERTCFPLPLEVKYLPTSTKQAFLNEVYISSAEKRMSSLFKKSDFFISEMDLIYRKAEQSAIFLRIHSSLPSFKLANYCLVMALNMNILLSKSRLENPSQTIINTFFDNNEHHQISKFEIISVLVTTGLGALVTLGYGLIIFTRSVTEIPLVIQTVDEEIKNEIELRITNRTMIKHSFWNIWFTNIFALVSTIAFIGLHYINFDANPGLYLLVILTLNTPLILITLRKNIFEFHPISKHQRKFAISYDLIVRRSFLRNHVILSVLCFLGYFVNVEFFTLELLDVVPISPIVSDIIKSVTSPGKALGLVFYLFCITVLIYASFGMNHFPSAIPVPLENEDGDIEDVQCSSVMQCFFMVFYVGLSESGKIKALLTSLVAGNDEFTMRIIYDSTFFVWVGIILLNVITGLIVDTFSSIREEKQTRTDSLANDCFVCGIIRNLYEDMAVGIVEAPNFDRHVSEEHNLWTYLYYVAYLKKKDPCLDTGIESYVRTQLEKQLLEWIPSRTSYVLGNAKK